MLIKKRLLQSMAATLLILSMIISLPVQAFAVGNAGEETAITVNTEGGKKRLNSKKIDGIWYVDAQGLADLANCQAQTSGGNEMLSISRRDTKCTLYTADRDGYTVINGTIYVPFQECSVMLGLCFHKYAAKDNFYVTSMRTPVELRALLDTIFSKKCYHLWEVPEELGFFWDTTEFFARLWAANPFTGNGSVLGTITMQDEIDRYDRAVSAMLSSSGDFLDLIYTFSELDDTLRDMGKKLSKSKKMINAAWNWIDGNKELHKQLEDAGVYELVREMFRTESNPYEGGFGDFLEGYPQVMNALNWSYFMEVFTFYGMAADGEEAMLLAMKKVFSQSSNPFLCFSTEKLFDSQFGSNAISLADIYGGYFTEYLLNSLSDHLDDVFYGGSSLLGKLFAQAITEIVEQAFDSPSINDISDAMIYYSIFSSIAIELSDYYYQHRTDQTEHIGADLRAVAIMYLNVARACVDKCRFDSDLEKATSNMDTVLGTDMVALLDFSDQEYDPEYTNQEFLAYLDALDRPPVSSPPSLPVPTTPATPIPVPQQASAAERQQAYLGYAELLNTGVVLNESAPGIKSINSTHYYLFEMDGDGIEEMIVYGSTGASEWSFAIFSYKNNQVVQIANSVDTCDISHWGNCTVTLSIKNGIMHAQATKATVSYTGSSENYLCYDGSRVTNYSTAAAVPPTSVVNSFILVSGESNNGIAIDSDNDFLRDLYLENHPVPAPSTSTADNGKNHPEQASPLNDIDDGSYDGELLSVEDATNGWVVTIDVTVPILCSDELIRGLASGDTLSIAGFQYQVVSVGSEFINFDVGFLARHPDGYWILCDPAGGAVVRSLGTKIFFVPSSARFVDNSSLEGIEVSSPWDIADGRSVRFNVADHQITYIERVYHP